MNMSTVKVVYPPGHNVGYFTVSCLRDLSRYEMEKQLQCGTLEPGSDVWIARLGLVLIFS